jgi:tellurite resistance protein TehA-like permease
MIRFLFRLLATFALAIAVIMAVLDVTRTIAASKLVLTPLGASWIGVSPASLEAAQAFVIDTVHPLAWNPVMVFILDQPGFAVFGVLAFLLYAIGRRPERRIGRFAVSR